MNIQDDEFGPPKVLITAPKIDLQPLSNRNNGILYKNQRNKGHRHMLSFEKTGMYNKLYQPNISPTKVSMESPINDIVK